ncbi:major facilitator superfamily domain-containing protein [Gongronella butleri]|nr:major facilitator superfamily domain-containing protein [Gongronella butleri]
MNTYLRSVLVLRPEVHVDPRTIPTWRKRWTLTLVTIFAIIPGFCSTIYLPALEAITAELDSSSIMVTLSNSLYMLFIGIAPIFYSSISDHWHIRRSVYFFTFVIYTIGSLCAIFATDINVLLGMRILQAVGISSAWAIGAGSVADIYSVEERGRPLSIYFAGSFAGPVLGPLIGGFLVEQWDWPSVFWMLFVIGCILLLLIAFTMEETYRDEARWNALPGDDEKPVAKRTMNPLASLALLRHPFVMISATATGLAFGGMFAIENMIPSLYTTTYGMSSGMIGLTFISPGLGEIVGSLFSGHVSHFFLHRAIAKRGHPIPEDRLAMNLWPAAFLLNPLAFCLWGWPVQLNWNVWVSIIMFGVQTFAMVQIFNPCLAYLVDAVPGRGASVTAAANLVRMIWACVLSLIANPMTEAVGPGWVTFLFGMLNLVWAFLILLLKVKGKSMRPDTL